MNEDHNPETIFKIQDKLEKILNGFSRQAASVIGEKTIPLYSG